MKKNLLPFIFVLCFGSFLSHAQSSGVLEHTTLEASYGYQTILNPSTPENISDWNGFNSLQLATRIPINKKIGFRGVYNYQSSKKDDMGTTAHRFVAEITYRWFPNSSSDSSSNKFVVMPHAGFGLGIISSTSLKSSSDKVGIALIGVMPEYKISDVVGVFLDLSYSANFSQDYNFNGKGFGEKFTGQVFTPSIGISLKPF